MLKAVRLLGLPLFLLLLISPVRAAWQNVGSITHAAQSGASGVILETSSGAKILISFFDLNVVRIRIAPSGNFENAFSYAIEEKLRVKPKIKPIQQTAKEVILELTSGEKVVVNKTFIAITIFDAAGEKLLADAAPAMFDRASGEIQATKMRRSSAETYYGFGEKASAALSRDSQNLTMWNTDTYRYAVNQDPLYQAIPFFIALDRGKAYGLFFHNSFRSSFDMGKSAPDKYTFSAEGGELDYFVFIGGKNRTPAKILEDYSNLTGRTPLPPVWALGYQQSRYSYPTQARVLEVAREFRRRQIPADVIYLDIDHMDGFRVFTWDKQKFPNPKEMTDDLAKINFRAVTIIDPAIKVDDKYQVYSEGKTENLFVKTADGRDFNGSVWAGNSAFPDFTDPKTRRWFGSWYRTYLSNGIAGFWNDMNEPSVFPAEKDNTPPLRYNPFNTIPLDARHNGDGAGGTHKRFHNVYGLEMAHSTFEGLQKLQPAKRPFVLTRAGFAGVQRYAAVWTGDNTASWEHLQMSVPMLLNLSVSGVPFVGADVGGYADMPSGELYARWLQAAALTPFLRSHSENNLPNKEPWEYGADFERINRASIELRYELLPYLYTLFREHEEDGKSVMRPLWFEYPKDLKTYTVDDEYLVGRDLLIAPVLKQGQLKRSVYFPAGDDWRDWQTGILYKGGTTAEVEASLEKLPLFARVGAIIPTQTVVQSTNEMPKADLTLHVITGVAPDKTDQSTVFQDAGDGYGYRENSWRENKIEHQKNLLKFKRFGNFADGQKIKTIEFLGIEIKPQEIRIDGKPVNIEFDQPEKRVRILLTSDNVTEIATIP